MNSMFRIFKSRGINIIELMRAKKVVRIHINGTKCELELRS